MVKLPLNKMIKLNEQQKVKHKIQSSVLMIQHNWREYRRVKKFQRVFRESMLRLKAVARIQRCWRNFKIRKIDKEKRSVLMIQKYMKGYA